MSVTAKHLETTNAHQRETTERERYFFLAMAGVAAALVFIGFAPTFFLRQYFSKPTLPTLLFVHGSVFSCWFVLLIAQATLVRMDRHDLHKRLGIAGACLAAVMVPLGIWVAIDGAAHGTSGARVTLPPLQFLIIPLGQIFIFGGLMTAAIALRRRPAVHKRLILIASINLIAPALARITNDMLHIASPIAIFVAVAILVAVCFAFDFATRRRVHAAFAIAGLASLISFPARIVFSQSDTWLSIANWLTR